MRNGRIHRVARPDTITFFLFTRENDHRFAQIAYILQGLVIKLLTFNCPHSAPHRRLFFLSYNYFFLSQTFIYLMADSFNSLDGRDRSGQNRVREEL